MSHSIRFRFLLILLPVGVWLAEARPAAAAEPHDVLWQRPARPPLWWISLDAWRRDHPGEVVIGHSGRRKSEPEAIRAAIQSAREAIASDGEMRLGGSLGEFVRQFRNDERYEAHILFMVSKIPQALPKVQEAAPIKEKSDLRPRRWTLGAGAGYASRTIAPTLTLGYQSNNLGLRISLGYGQNSRTDSTFTSTPGAPFSGRGTKTTQTSRRALPISLGATLRLNQRVSIIGGPLFEFDETTVGTKTLEQLVDGAGTVVASKTTTSGSRTNQVRKRMGGGLILNFRLFSIWADAYAGPGECPYWNSGISWSFGS